jgi:hypothetical protein
VQAGIERLAQFLEDDLAQAREYYVREFHDPASKYWDHDDYDHDHEYDGVLTGRLLESAVESWQEKSCRHISKVFKRLFRVVRELGHSDTEAAKRTCKFCCEAIREVFLWTESNETNPAKFKEWLGNCGSRTINRTDDKWAMTPECEEKIPIPIAECLSNSFRIQFKSLLKQLKNDAILSPRGMPITTNEVASTGVPTKKDEVASPGMPATTDEKQGQSSSTQPWYWSKELSARESTISTPARAGLVSLIRGELEFHRKRLSSLPASWQILKEKHPKCVAFDIYANNEKRHERFDKCIYDGQIVELAYSMASTVAGCSTHAMKAAYNFKRKQKRG